MYTTRIAVYDFHLSTSHPQSMYTGLLVQKNQQGDMDILSIKVYKATWGLGNTTLWSITLTWDIGISQIRHGTSPPPPTPHQGARPSLFTCSYVPVHGIPMINDPPPGASPALGGNVQMAQSRRRISSPRLKPICLCR